MTLCSLVVKHQCMEEPAANVRSGLAVGRVAWISAGSTSILVLGESR